MSLNAKEAAGGRAYVDGAWCSEATAAVPISDRAFLYGDAVFETLRTYNGKPFLLERHLDRLLASCEELGITPRESREELSAIVTRLAAEVGVEAYLRVTVSRGSGYGPWPAKLPEHGRTVAVARPLSPYPPELYARGLRLVTSRLARSELSPLAVHKTANYLEPVLARGEAAERGADESLLLNSSGAIAELAAANIFAIVYGRIFTPREEDGALPGITRGLVLDLAGRLDVPTHCGPLVPEALADADEAFATNSLLEICPVCEIDGNQIGEVMPGPLTVRLQAAYREEVEKRCPASAP